MERALDIAIVGYGIAGIAAAINLRRSRHHLTHFERSDPPVTGGAGMLLHPAAMRELEKLGVLTAALECGAPVRNIRAQTVSGRSLMDFRYGDVIDGQFGLGIQRGTLHRLLSNADPGRTRVIGGRPVTSIEPAAGCLTIEDGVRHGPFDLIVVADGMHSELRSQVFASVSHDRSARSAALVGLFQDPQQLAADRLAQYFDRNRHLSVWPVGREHVGAESRAAFAINVSLAEAETFRAEDGRRERLMRLCSNLWSLAEAELASLHLAFYRDVELPQTCVGRVAFIGDAAHSMSPQLGTGAQLAMEDAATLANVVDAHKNVADALRAFMRIRIPHLQRYHRASRWLTPLFQSDSRPIAFLRDQLLARAMNSSPARQIAHAFFS